MLIKFDIFQIEAFEQHEVTALFEGALNTIRKQTECDDGISSMHVQVSAQRMIDELSKYIDRYVAARLSDIVADLAK